MKRFAGLPCFSLTVRCVGVSSAFRLPTIGVIGLVASVAWRGSVSRCNTSVSRNWNGDGQLVGRSVE